MTEQFSTFWSNHISIPFDLSITAKQVISITLNLIAISSNSIIARSKDIIHPR